MDFTQRPCSEEVENCPIGGQGDGHRFLEFSRYDLYTLTRKQQEDHRALPCLAFGLVRQWFANDGPIWRINIFFHPLQRTGSNLRTLYSQIFRIVPLTAAPPAVLARFFLCDFLFSNFNKSLVVQTLSSVRRSSQPRRPTLQTSRKHFLQLGQRIWNTAESSISSWKGHYIEK